MKKNQNKTVNKNASMKKNQNKTVEKNDNVQGQCYRLVRDG